MKIAIATDNYTRVAGHAGKARHWLLYMLHGYRPQELLPAAPTLIKLAPEQVMHHFKDDAPHPLERGSGGGRQRRRGLYPPHARARRCPTCVLISLPRYANCGICFRGIEGGRGDQAMAITPFFCTMVNKRKAGPPGFLTPRSQSDTRLRDTFK